MKDYLMIGLTIAAIVSVVFVLISDPWFIETVIGRAFTVLILSVGAFILFMAGMHHGIKLSRKNMEGVLESWEND